MADTIHSNGKSKRIIIRTVYDFRRHLSLLLDVDVLVIPTISSKLFIPHCAPVLESLIALPTSTLWFLSYKRKWQVAPCLQQRREQGHKGSGLREWKHHLLFFEALLMDILHLPLTLYPSGGSSEISSPKCELECHLCHGPAVWLGRSHLTCLVLSFLIYKMKIMISNIYHVLLMREF